MQPVERTIFDTREHAELISRLLRIAVQDRDMASILRDALDELLALSWLSLLPKAGVFLTDAESGDLTLVASRDLGPEIETACARVPLGQCLCGRAALKAQTLHADCVDHRHEIRFDGMAPHGHYNVPIRLGGRVLGVLVVYLPHGHQKNDGEVEFLESYCNALALIIQLKLREEALRSAKDSLKSALRDSEALMSVVRDHTIYCQADPDGVIIDANEKFCAISGYDREEILGATHGLISSASHPPAFWQDLWGRILSGRAWRGEICNRSKNGDPFWVDTVIAPKLDPDGTIDSFIAMSFDVTERKHAEERLGRLGRILDRSDNEIYVFDAGDRRFTLVNDGARENLGYSMARLYEMTPVDIKPELDEAAFEALIAPLRDGETDMLTFETVHERRDGSRYPVEVKLHFARQETPPVFVAIVQDITRRRAAAARIERLAYYDPLTDLPNRSLFLDRLSHAIARAKRAGSPLSLLFIDLNRFKEINDTRGHAAGDLVLQEISRRFQAVLRGGDTLARLAGDEFVVLSEGADRTASVQVVKRLQDALAAPLEIGAEKFILSASIGVVSYPEDGQSADALLQRADIAMYQAKGSGGGYRVYQTEMGAELERRLEMTQRLGRALESGVLEMWYQPQVSLRTGRLSGAEALMRWHDPEWGWISPGAFIPLAVERRLMPALGHWAMKSVFRQVGAWREAGAALPGRVAINIDAQQVEDLDFVDRVARLLDDCSVSASLFTFELTESGIMADLPRATSVIRSLKEMGFDIAIDDFGTGYSSLSYLQKFSADALKIDISFVRDMLEQRSSHAIVAATIAMARSLGVKTLAEGVETEAHATALNALGCGEAQGYFFGRPQKAEVFASEWLAGLSTPAPTGAGETARTPTEAEAAPLGEA